MNLRVSSDTDVQV